jgi:hypothetical protein
MKPATTSLDNPDFSFRKLPLKIKFRGRPLDPKSSILDALATQFHKMTGLGEGLHITKEILPPLPTKSCTSAVFDSLLKVSTGSASLLIKLSEVMWV